MFQRDHDFKTEALCGGALKGLLHVRFFPDVHLKPTSPPSHEAIYIEPGDHPITSCTYCYSTPDAPNVSEIESLLPYRLRLIHILALLRKMTDTNCK